MARNGTRTPAVPIALCLLAPAPAAADGAPVEWKGRKLAPAELEGELGEWPTRAATGWSEWAGEHGYGMHLTEDGRVLLLVHRRSRGAREIERLVDRTAALLDEIAPVPEREADPEPRRSRRRWSWRDDGAPLASETAVLLQARNPDDYAAALDHLASEEPYLASWVAEGKQLAGCALERPLFAAWLESGPGLQEWDPRNELVHRLAQLLVMRGFGGQPFWVLCGIGWHAEHELRRGVYCFPYRDEFVWATEHTSWKKDLRSQLARAVELAVEDVVALERGSYDGENARLAWGAVRFLVEAEEDAFPRVLERFRLLRDEKGVEKSGDGSWRRIVSWEPSPEDVRLVLEEEVGPDALERMLAFLK